MIRSVVKITDVCVPLSKIADCIEETKVDIEKSGLLAPMVGHLGDGNFHLFILIDPKNPKELETLHNLDHRLVRRAIAMEGTCTGEHGVGVGKRQYLLEEHGKDAVDLMRLLKKSIDPDNVSFLMLEVDICVDHESRKSTSRRINKKFQKASFYSEICCISGVGVGVFEYGERNIKI